MSENENLDISLFKYMTDEEIDVKMRSVINAQCSKGGKQTKGWTERDKIIRRQAIINLICKGYSYRRIMEDIMSRWGVGTESVNRYYKDAFEYLTSLNQDEKENAREKATERLEAFLELCMNSNDRKNYITALEQLNRLNGLYTEKKEVSIKDTELRFKFGDEE